LPIRLKTTIRGAGYPLLFSYKKVSNLLYGSKLKVGHYVCFIDLREWHEKEALLVIKCSYELTTSKHF